MEIERGVGFLRCSYTVRGAADALIWDAGRPGKTDGLWRHTCCELFLKPAGEGYLEFNFSPSTQWAAYQFDRYREGMRDASCVPRLAVELSRTSLMLGIEIDIDEAVAYSAGLSAVIETKDGAKSYWALRHPPGKPDFHHPDCFALKLPAASSP